MNCNNPCNFCGNNNSTWVLVIIVILVLLLGGFNGCNNCEC